jgi:hypothetical protein
MPKAEATGEKKETQSAGEFHQNTLLGEPSHMSPLTSIGDISQNRDDSDQKYTIQAAGSSSFEDPPVKRGRGRPKGSKIKKAAPTPAGESSSAPPLKRRRPPKVPACS